MSVTIHDPMESTERDAFDAGPNRASRLSGLTRLGRGLAAIAAVLVVLYMVAGYLSSADMFGNHPRWRGMNRKPADFGLLSETASFDSTDGIPPQGVMVSGFGYPTRGHHHRSRDRSHATGYAASRCFSCSGRLRRPAG
jgi:hypothetical protein